MKKDPQDQKQRQNLDSKLNPKVDPNSQKRPPVAPPAQQPAQSLGFTQANAPDLATQQQARLKAQSGAASIPLAEKLQQIKRELDDAKKDPSSNALDHLSALVNALIGEQGK